MEPEPRGCRAPLRMGLGVRGAGTPKGLGGTVHGVTSRHAAPRHHSQPRDPLSLLTNPQQDPFTINLRIHPPAINCHITPKCILNHHQQQFPRLFRPGGTTCGPTDGPAKDEIVKDSTLI